ncbi:hypothetical protein U9M48_017000 [Paspalum notatum var. saurae]|uniref:Uncharacterized protein n=1 Tax=Paspalum notatum var. saurae TaxID=547442 RepID=A0AAQ3T6U1_PASNO
MIISAMAFLLLKVFSDHLINGRAEHTRSNAALLDSRRVRSMEGEILRGQNRIKPTPPLASSSTSTRRLAAWLPYIRAPLQPPSSAIISPPLPCQFISNQSSDTRGKLGFRPHQTHQRRPPRDTCGGARERRRTQGGVESIRHGEVSLLREGAHEQGRVDQGGGPAPDRLHQGARRGVLALAAQGRGAPALRQELQAALDELPPPGPQARQLHRRRRRAHHQAPRPARQQVVADRGAAARPDGQRDQELLEHAHQAQAAEPGHRPADAPPAQRRRGQRAHHVQHRRVPVPVAGAAQARAPGHRRAAAQCGVRAPGALGGRPQQQRREHGPADALPRPQPRPRPLRRPAVLAA